MIYQWAVIGAGPAGIAAIGKLLDEGVISQTILWIDPEFAVGDLGRLWQNVPSNTTVALFLKFLTSVQAFDYVNCPKDFALNHADLEQTCQLALMVDPLQWITDQLTSRVHFLVGMAQELFFSEQVWHIILNDKSIAAKNVILATGAEPKTSALASLPIIPLQDAMDAERIHQHIQASDTVAVFGSSHSAVLVLRNLVENGVQRIVNFYRSPLRYAVYLDDWILFDDTGLKGSTATWAREYLDNKALTPIARVYSNEENLQHHLPYCQKIVYALGFERRLLPIIKGYGVLPYNEECGILAPGLFGLGIGFPESKLNPLGIREHRVGLWKFMDYLQRVLPLWMRYSA